MHIFIAGASGALGRRLVTLLLEAGHEVTGMTRSHPEVVARLGATPVVADALDRDEVLRAVSAAEPDAIIHQLTALGGGVDLRKLDRAFRQTNALRTRGTDHLLEAAAAAGARRFVAQSFAAWPYKRVGGPVKREEDPLEDDPPASVKETLAAVLYLERAVTAAGGIALRYGGFYGPGTSLSADGEHTDLVRKRRFPIVGGGTGVTSFVHIDDAAAATVAALERGRPGAIYNVCDDEPAPVAEWLPVLSEVVGAKPPRRVPRWIGRLAAGDAGVAMMTSIRGASNTRAKQELAWTPQWRSWRDGFARGLA